MMLNKGSAVPVQATGRDQSELAELRLKQTALRQLSHGNLEKKKKKEAPAMNQNFAS